MIYIHSYLDKEGIVNTLENKQFYHTIENQDICHKIVPFHAMLMNHALTVQLSNENLEPNNFTLLEV